MADMMNLESEEWDSDMFDDVFGDIPDRIILLVFLIDCSGSMEGTIIGTINSIMEELFSDLDGNNIRISVLQIDKEIRWNSEHPMTIQEYGSWNRIHAGSLSHLGEAFMQLGKKLEDKTWCSVGKNGIEGVFVLFSDGMATDHYEDGMKYLKANTIFKHGKKLAINFSERKDSVVLNEFTGNEHNVMDISNRDISKAEKKILSLVNES